MAAWRERITGEKDGAPRAAERLKQQRDNPSCDIYQCITVRIVFFPRPSEAQPSLYHAMARDGLEYLHSELDAFFVDRHTGKGNTLDNRN
jgi:hypothetical protein